MQQQLIEVQVFSVIVNSVIKFKLSRFIFLISLPAILQAGLCRADEINDFASLKKVIEDKNLASIAEVLPYLSESFRSRYALMFQSRSLHGSDFENPRVLLYGKDAKFIVSFNGAAEQKNYAALEISEFDEHRKEFQYREILFPEDMKTKGPVTFSSANPEKCAQCHGTPARPLWDTHPLWPGAYGERYLTPLSLTEQQGLTKFLAQQALHPRYKYLSHVETFTNKETFYPTAKTLYYGSAKESPNAELSKFLSRYNSERIIQIIQKMPNFEKYQYALLGSLSQECGGVENFMPFTWRPDFIKKYKDFESFTLSKNTEQQHLKQSRAISRELTSSGIMADLTSFRFLVETGLGISTSQWSPALETETYDFTAPQPIVTEMLNQLVASLGPSEKIAKSLFSLKQVSNNKKYCSYLTTKSIAALNSVTPSFSLPVVAVRPSLVQRCADCHQLGLVGPSIPFNQTKSLAALLSTGKYPHGTLLDEILFRISPNAGADRMPRGMNITESEQHELEKYFRALSLTEKKNP